MRKSSFPLLNSENRRGFTIIEILIGMCILSIGILAVTVMQTSTVRNNKIGNVYTQASALARAQMELIKNSDIEDTAGILNPAAYPTTTNDPNNPLDENGQPGGIYNRSWTVANYMEDSNADGIADTASEFARTITVTVTFPLIGSDIRQVSLTSVIAGGGL